MKQLNSGKRYECEGINMSRNISKNTSWIWMDVSQKNQPNQYVEFRRDFQLSSAPQKGFLRISVDTNFVAWINGALVGCGQFSDFPNQGTYSEIDISRLLKTDKNVIAILVHYCGEDTFSYLPGDASLWYEVEVEENIVAKSCEKTLCRTSPCYLQENTTRVNLQRGFTFNYDASRDDDWLTEKYRCDNSWHNAVAIEQDTTLQPRPLKMLDLIK